MTTSGILLDNLDEIMEENETPKINNRSESAKKMWQRRKSVKTQEPPMTQQPQFKAWVYHTEWFTLMAALVGCFIFVHNESVHTNERLDAHIEQINKRVDDSNNQLNKRCDELHKEFYELLKESRK
jgi:hypothetical protein